MNNWQKILQAISEFEVVAKWTLNNGYGSHWMLVPNGGQIKVNCFTEDAMSPLKFDELAHIEIFELYEHGNIKIENDIDLIQRTLSQVKSVLITRENGALKVESI